MVLALTFRSLELELILCMRCELGVQLYSLNVGIQASQHYLLKKLFFPH